MANATVLVVDDEQLIRWSLVERLRDEGHDVVEAGTGAEALERCTDGVDLVLLDFRLPDGDGLGLLRQMRRQHPDVVVIMMTAYTSVDTAVQAMKEGAYHYVGKPFNLDEVAVLVQKALETTALRREVRALRAGQAEQYDLDRIVGDSPVMQQLKGLLTKVAVSPASTVLLTGESGTGKDLAAKVIHHLSARAGRPFMNITCSALPEPLLESELFGHERGAFTGAIKDRPGRFELAEGGTIFLDDIDDIPNSVQVKLLRVLQNRTVERVGGTRSIPVNVRVITGSKRNLKQLVAEAKFREDLYYRLNVVPIVLPPLRERREDIPILMDHFLTRYFRERGEEPKPTASAVRQAFLGYSWPGNVRELENACERVAQTCTCDAVRLGCVPASVLFHPQLEVAEPVIAT